MAAADGAVCDVTAEAALTALAAEHGDVDLVCANAGILAGGTVMTMAASEFRRVLEVNVVGTVNTVRAFLPALQAARGDGDPASILITGSDRSLGVPPNESGGTAYTTSKHAVLGFAVCLRRDLADEGIGVTLLCPGYVRTERLLAMASQEPAFAAILSDHAQDVDDVARLAFDGLAADHLLVATNPASTPYVNDLHTAILDAMPASAR